MDASDIAEIQGVISTIIQDRPVSLEIHRGDAKLTAQTVRLVKPGSKGANVRTSQTGAHVTADYLVLGAVDLNIMRGDRFAIGGRAFEVIFVDASSQVKRVAEVVLRD